MRLPSWSVRIPKRSHFSLLALGLTLSLAEAHGAAAPVPLEGTARKEARLEALQELEARCTDGSVLKLKVLEESVTLRTPYGKLVIPFAKIKAIECATRTTEETAKRVGTAVSRLGSARAKEREAASAELAKLKVKAYPALLQAEKSKDPEVQLRARKLLEDLRKAVSEDDLVVRKQDVIETEDSRIAGHIEGVAFRVNTEQFGEVRLKLSDLRGLRSPSGELDATGGTVFPDSGNLTGFQMHVGKTFAFRVTGAVNGRVWGTDTYTLDSVLSVAAVHAGAIQAGKTGVVRVKILPAQAAFAGTARNGVTTTNYAAYPGAFEFIKKKK
jgi:hypothetical protein